MNEIVIKGQELDQEKIKKELEACLIEEFKDPITGSQYNFDDVWQL